MEEQGKSPLKSLRSNDEDRGDLMQLDEFGRTENSPRKEETSHAPPAVVEVEAAVAAEAPNKRIYIGNISYQVQNQDLLDFCVAKTLIKPESAHVMMLPNGQSKGCGIVVFNTSQEAQKSIDLMHEQEWMGRKVFVRLDRESDEFTQRSLSKPSRPTEQGRQLFVGNLPFRSSWQDLKDLFKSYGSIIRADILNNPDGRSKGCGIVLFEREQDANTAISTVNGYEYSGRRLEVRLDRHADAYSSRQRGYKHQDRGYGGRSRDYDRRDRRDRDYGRRDDGYSSSRRDGYSSSRRDDGYSSSSRRDYNRDSNGVDRHQERARSRSPISAAAPPSLQPPSSAGPISSNPRADDDDVNLYD